MARSLEIRFIATKNWARKKLGQIDKVTQIAPVQKPQYLNTLFMQS
jgi:hypothetical protein